jgi:hypothetical protein
MTDDLTDAVLEILRTRLRVRTKKRTVDWESPSRKSLTIEVVLLNDPNPSPDLVADDDDVEIISTTEEYFTEKD